MKTLKFIAIAAIAAFSFSFQAHSASAQKSNVYSDGDNACMVGDSITAGGWFTCNAMLYYATRFPHMEIRFDNAGVSGDGCNGILWRMESDILPNLDKRRTVTAIMIGMNDVGRSKFSKPERERLGEEAFQNKILSVRKNYADKLSRIVKTLSENSRKLVVFTPSIYDQTAQVKSENLIGVNDELENFGEICKTLSSQAENAECVDMSAATGRANAELQKREGKDKSVIGPDRIHPGFAGGLVMLDAWLSKFREPSRVSEIGIDAKSKALKNQFNCEISNLKFENGRISFDTEAGALPFPVEKKSRNVADLLGFCGKFNREILRVAGLPAGKKYSLKIDGSQVAVLGSQELSDGVNLAENQKTPQYLQAESVYGKCLLFRSKAAEYRGILMIELFNRKDMDELDTDGKIDFVKRKIQNDPPDSKFILNACKFYVKNKKRQSDLLGELRSINADIYAAAKPKKRSYEIAEIRR